MESISFHHLGERSHTVPGHRSDIDNFERADGSTLWRRGRTKCSGNACSPACLTASWRSQGGSGAGLALSCSPTCRITRLEAQLFRVTLHRRLQLSLPFTERSCRCGLPLDFLGHHRAACASWGFGQEGKGSREYRSSHLREGRGRVRTNVLVHDLDLALPGAVADGRRPEVVVDGLPLFGGAQLAVNTTLVCALRSDGRPTTRLLLKMKPRSPERDGGRRPLTQSWLADTPGRVWWCWVVEVGGRFSSETQSFLSQLARAKARCGNSILRVGSWPTLAKPTLAKTDFGQNRLWPNRLWPRLWPNRLWPKRV